MELLQRYASDSLQEEEMEAKEMLGVWYWKLFVECMKIVVKKQMTA